MGNSLKSMLERAGARLSLSLSDKFNEKCTLALVSKRQRPYLQRI